MRLITITFLMTTVFNSWSQSTSDTTVFDKSKNNLLQTGVCFEVGYQSSTYASLGAIVGKGFGELRGSSFGAGASLDILYNGTTAYFGPRIFGVINFGDFLGVRFGAANYMRENNSINDLRLSIEVCLSFGGRFGLNGGLSLPVVAKNYTEIGSFRVGVTVNLAK